MLKLIEPTATPFSVRLVPRDEIPALWNEYRDLVLKALSQGFGRYEERDVLLALLAEQMHLWVHPDAIAITQIIMTPRKKVFQVIWCAGDGLANWMWDGIGKMERMAIKAGCHQFEVLGRPGWKVLGMEERYRVYGKDLT